MKIEFLNTLPVLPTSDIQRDVKWYKEKLGLEIHLVDDMYAVLFRENFCIHLQWHADTKDDPLLGGSVIRVLVKNIEPIFEELISRGTVTIDKMRRNTPWGTNEFGFHDLNGNAIIILEEDLL